MGKVEKGSTVRAQNPSRETGEEDDYWYRQCRGEQRRQRGTEAGTSPPRAWPCRPAGCRQRLHFSLRQAWKEDRRGSPRRQCPSQRSAPSSLRPLPPTSSPTQVPEISPLFRTRNEKLKDGRRRASERNGAKCGAPFWGSAGRAYRGFRNDNAVRERGRRPSCWMATTGS